MQDQQTDRTNSLNQPTVLPSDGSRPNFPVYRTTIFSLFFLLVAATPGAACSVCFTEDGYLVRWMYYLTTASMILLPALMITGFVYWIRTQGRSSPDEPS